MYTGKRQGQEGATWGSRHSPPAFLTLTSLCAHPADPMAVKLENFPIHAITGVLKQWLRELPEPLMTFAQYGDFLRAVGESLPLWQGRAVGRGQGSGLSLCYGQSGRRDPQLPR